MANCSRMAAQIGVISEIHASFALFASGGCASNRDKFKCYIKTKVQTLVWYRVDIRGWQNSWQNNRGKWTKFQVPRAWWWNAHRSAATYYESRYYHCRMSLAKTSTAAVKSRHSCLKWVLLWTEPRHALRSCVLRLACSRWFFLFVF